MTAPIGRATSILPAQPVTPAHRADANADADKADKATKAGAADKAKAAKDRELGVASREFEAIFVRSMLASSNIGGKGAYGDMAVDALAKSVTAGRGLGLGELVRKAVEQNVSHPLKVRE